MGKTVLIIGAGVMQVPLIRKAKEMGLRVVATDRDPRAPGLAWADVAEMVDTHDAEGTLRVARAHRVDGVTTASDFPVRTAAYIAEQMGLPGIPRDAAAAATDKFEMRERLKAAGAPIPRYARATTSKEAVAAAGETGFPLVVKPPDKSGSRGVSIVERAEDLDAAFRRAYEESGTGYVLVEEFLRGHEISVETFCWEGETRIVALTEKFTTDIPYFVEMGHIVPLVLPEEQARRVADVARHATAALGVTMGATHTELKIDGDDVRVVEIGARLGGDFITTKLVPLALGVDLTKAVLSAAVGEKPALEPTLAGSACVRFLAAPPGKLYDVSGLGAARSAPCVVEAEMIFHPGEIVRQLRSSMDRAAYVITAAPTREEAKTAAENAAGYIQFIME